jgi:hypothetical protein
VGPLFGLVIGGVLDRAFEEGRNRSWGRALVFAIGGLALCIGAVYLIDAAAYGPDPEELSRKARALILSKWSKDPQLAGASIQTVTLVRQGRTAYTGQADATIDGQPARLVLEVLPKDGEFELRWTVEPF